MLRIYVKIEDLLLEGETYQQIMEELRLHNTKLLDSLGSCGNLFLNFS